MCHLLRVKKRSVQMNKLMWKGQEGDSCQIKLKIGGWMDEKNGIRNANRRIAVSEKESGLAQEVKIFSELDWKYLNTCVIEDRRKWVLIFKVWRFTVSLQPRNSDSLPPSLPSFFYLSSSLSLFLCFFLPFPLSLSIHLWHLRSTRKEKILATAFEKLLPSITRLAM